MFLYKDNRFHFNNISFCLPDNVFLNVSCEEYSNCIELVPSAEDFRIIIYGECENRRAEQFFRKNEAEECYTCIGELTPITVGNADGYLCSYKSNYNTYAEFRFNTDNESQVLGILILGKTRINICETKENSIVNDLLNSLLK